MFEEFKDRFPILPEKWAEYVGYYHRIEVPAKTVLLREGDVSKRAFLVEQGCLRLWFDHDGKDVSFQFFFEKEAVSSIESFRRNVPSLFTLESIEPCVLHWIHKDDMDKIFAELQEDGEMRKVLMDGLLDRQLHYMQQYLSFIRDTPTQRYLNLVQEKPHIVQRVAQHYIASYLGITPVSLSRIRNKLKGTSKKR